MYQLLAPESVGTHCAIGRLRLSRERPRRAGRLLRRPDDGAASAYDLVFACGGAVTFRQGDQDGIAEAGQYVLFSRDRLYELEPEDETQILCLTIPAGDLRHRHPGIEDSLARRFDQDARMAGLLRGVLETLCESFADAPPPHAQALATEVVSLVALVLGTESRGEKAAGRASRHRLKARIIAFIDANLDDIDLSPRKIADANRISLSYLYSLFCDNDASVSKLIKNRRLQRAYEILLSDTQGAMMVSEVAYRVGFKNPSHFSRIFTERYRVSPRNIREQRWAIA